jgi:AraC-like DNA-binding protein
MDVLSDVLQAVRLKGALYFDVRTCEPVVAETPAMADIGSMVLPDAEHVISFHIMLSGECWVETMESGNPPVRLEEGDIIIFPHGHPHAFVTHLGERNPPDFQLYATAHGGPLPLMLDLQEAGPKPMRFVCGYFGCCATPYNPLLQALPAQILAKRPEEGNHMEVDLIQAAVEEAGSTRAGGTTILSRLSELLFVRVIRRYIEQLPDHSRGWLAGLRDPNIRKALERIHADPACEWTLEELGRQCGLSRAVFAERFANQVGETPIRYLAKWRMQIAAGLLEQPGVPIEAIAEQVGYKSEAAFNRAFKNIVGLPPGAWRRGQRATPDGASADLQSAPDDWLSCAAI